MRKACSQKEPQEAGFEGRTPMSTMSQAWPKTKMVLGRKAGEVGRPSFPRYWALTTVRGFRSSADKPPLTWEECLHFPNMFVFQGN